MSRVVPICHGGCQVARNMVGDDVIEVLLSNNPGASGGPVVDKKGKVSPELYYILYTVVVIVVVVQHYRWQIGVFYGL